MNDQNSKRLYIKGYIDFPADQFDTLKDAWEQHVALSRAEEGCLSFEFEYDSDVAGRVSIAETYVNEDAFEAHKARAMKAGWVELSKDAQRHLKISDTPFT